MMRDCSIPDSIVQLAVDNTRNTLYSRSEKGSIQVHLIKELCFNFEMKVLLCAVFVLFRSVGCLEIYQSFVISALNKILDISTEERRIAPTPSTPQS